MKVEAQEDKVVIVLTLEEAKKVEEEFDNLVTIRDEFDPENGPRAPVLAAIVDKLSR